MSITSGLNAIAHAAEALYAQNCNPITSLMAQEAISALAHALPRIVQSPHGSEARADALYGAWLCGSCLGSVGMALHHKLCHVLGGSFDLPHAETHAVVLPHAITFNSPACPDAMDVIALAIGATDAGLGLSALARRLGAPRALRDLGMPEFGIVRAAEQVVRDPYWNPRPVTLEAARDLIARAWAGEEPSA